MSIYKLILRFLLAPGIVILCFNKPVRYLGLYNGPIQEIEITYYEFPEPLRYICLPMKEGKNIVVAKTSGNYHSISYLHFPALDTAEKMQKKYVSNLDNN